MIESWSRAELKAIKEALTEFSTKNDEIRTEFKKIEQVINYHAKQIEAAERVLKIVVRVLGIGTGGPPIVGEH